MAIGGAHARHSYLNLEASIDAAREAGADAIHPGYGFLSESARFAEACADGIVFVGPSADGIGDVAAARRLARRFRIEGIKTTVPLHARLVEDERVQSGDVHTSYLEERVQGERVG